jgi:hypothetical protein
VEKSEKIWRKVLTIGAIFKNMFRVQEKFPSIAMYLKNSYKRLEKFREKQRIVFIVAFKVGSL